MVRSPWPTVYDIAGFVVVAAVPVGATHNCVGSMHQLMSSIV